jgi:hypothetical protein
MSVPVVEPGPDVQDALVRGCLATFAEVRFAVTGGCMRPVLAPGDVVRLAARSPALGDVVLVRLADGLRLHRLVPGPPRGGSWTRTKADQAPAYDPPFAAGALLGTVVGVEAADGVRTLHGRWRHVVRSLLRLRRRR